MSSASNKLLGEYEVKLINDERIRWNDFVNENSGSYCHQYEWRLVLQNAYRLKTFYLAITQGSDWVGILPLAVIPGIGRQKAVSVPYCNYGGLLVAQTADVNHVKNAALAFLRHQGIHLLEVRELCKMGGISSGGVTMLLDLPKVSDALWKRIGDKARNQVRKAQRSGLEVQWGREQASDLYGIYAENMGRLGTPVHARAFVDGILMAFGDQADVLTVRLQGRAIAAMLVLKYGDTWIDPIASGLVEFKKFNPNMLLYWEALKQAISVGTRRFDFGRSQRESGTYKFKSQWGAVATPLNYYSYVNGIQVASASTDIYRGSKAAIFSKVWSKLPSHIQLVLGPKIRRYIP